MIVYLLPIFMFLVLMLLVFTSYPIGFVLGGISIVFGVIGWMFGVFSPIEFFNFAPRIWFIADNFQIIAVPLFVCMGVKLERSEIAKELLEALQLILRRVPGGMAMSVTVMATIFAAITGIIGAAVVVMTLIAFVAFSAATQGWLLFRLRYFERVLLFISFGALILFIIFHSFVMLVAGIACSGIPLMRQLTEGKKLST